MDRLTSMKRLVAHLAQVSPVELSLRLWDGTSLPLAPGAPAEPALTINSPVAITRLMRRPRLTTFVELLAEGLVTIDGGTLLDLAAQRGAGSTRGLWRRLDKTLVLRSLLPFLAGAGKAAGQGHAFAGAQAARHEAGRDDKALVQFHYDLSNEFYARFLDPEMVYSCAYFPDPAMDLAQAQQAKLEMICRKLRLQPGERFLDIGCGWGGLVCHAARHHGVMAHGVTLSQAQHDFAQAKIDRLGLRERVTIELRDFRSLQGEFDKIASIGMFEHVGLDNRDGYFRQIRGLLRPRGIYLHHAIARPMKKDERSFRRKRPEFAALVNYVFPGGELDHIGGTTDAMERNGFEIHDTEGWREHYGRTCRLWTERLYAARAEAAAEVGEARVRLWLLYLAGVCLAFERGTVGIFQTVATRRTRGPAELPPSRADLYRPMDLPRTLT